MVGSASMYQGLGQPPVIRKREESYAMIYSYLKSSLLDFKEVGLLNMIPVRSETEGNRRSLHWKIVYAESITALGGQTKQQSNKYKKCQVQAGWWLMTTSAGCREPERNTLRGEDIPFSW